MKELFSPNFDRRADGSTISYVILHYTGMETAQLALARLCSPESKVSAHYVIDEDGTVYQLVDEVNRAWHAGVSYWKGEDDLNSQSIGIELVNPGHACGYRPFPEVQITALKELLRSLYEKHGLNASSLLAHSDVAPDRKEDPGELFPWKELAMEGFGLWAAEDSNTQPIILDRDQINERLRTIGYYCPEDNMQAQLSAYIAFFRHYHPDRLMGGFDVISLHRLISISEQTKNLGLLGFSHGA